MRYEKNTEILTQEDVKSFLQVYTIGKERRQILEERRLHLIGELRSVSPGSLEGEGNIAFSFK